VAVDTEGHLPRSSIDELARAGLLGLGLPGHIGGPGGGPLESVEAVEKVAGACASTGVVYAKHRVPYEPGGYHDLIEAVAAGSIVVGGGEPR